MVKAENNDEIKDGLYKKYIKRSIDFILASFSIILFSPLLIVIAVIIKFKLGSPVIFKQDRPGLNEKIFTMYKFRTMTEGRCENGELLPDSERLTRFGEFLRSTSLDELPELWNIVCGHMGIVGPRPLLVRYLPYYTQEEKKRHNVRPGLTGLSQVNGRNFLEWNKRLELDIKYVNNITFLQDLRIVFLTLKKVIQREDIVVGSQHIMDSLDIERGISDHGNI